MKGYRIVHLLVSLLLISMATAAQAGVPCPDLSTVEAVGDGDATPEAAVCPAGDYDGVVVTVTAIDCFGEPVPGMEVTVYPDPEATGFCFCPGEETKSDSTDSAGMMTVVFDRFGGCGYLQWHAEARGVIMFPSDPIFVNSPEGYGNDCEINLMDFVYFATHYLGTEPCCDYNRDGFVNLADFIHFAEHYSHTCE
jgi:hypothetical protein